MQLETSKPYGRLVDAAGLLEKLFDPDAKPSMRWLREQQKSKAIPFVRIGRLVFFDPEQVRAALEKRTIKAR